MRFCMNRVDKLILFDEGKLLSLNEDILSGFYEHLITVLKMVYI
jgi:hypothetical protein